MKQSLEMVLSASNVSSLDKYLDPETLVVGPALPGHDFEEGYQALRGRTCPWNTAALWNVRKLALIGFPLVGDGVVGANIPSGGVEVPQL